MFYFWPISFFTNKESQLIHLRLCACCTRVEGHTKRTLQACWATSPFGPMRLCKKGTLIYFRKQVLHCCHYSTSSFHGNRVPAWQPICHSDAEGAERERLMVQKKKKFSRLIDYLLIKLVQLNQTIDQFSARRNGLRLAEIRTRF